jgi:hypothetical protein
MSFISPTRMLQTDDAIGTASRDAISVDEGLTKEFDKKITLRLVRQVFLFEYAERLTKEFEGTQAFDTSR